MIGLLLINVVNMTCCQLIAYRANSVLLIGSPLKMKTQTLIILLLIAYGFLIFSGVVFQYVIVQEQNGIDNAKEFLKVKIDFILGHQIVYD